MTLLLNVATAIAVWAQLDDTETICLGFREEGFPKHRMYCLIDCHSFETFTDPSHYDTGTASQLDQVKST